MTSPRRILFVGLETALRRELLAHAAGSPLGSHFTFARGFLEAMALLATGPCDAVVAELALPGFSGAQLLSEVMHRHARILRFLLAQPQRLPASPKCSGAAHQVLLQPVAAVDLLATLGAAFQKETWIPGEQAQRLLARMPTLPAPPEVYFQIEQARRTDQLDADRFADLVSESPELAGHLPRLCQRVAERESAPDPRTLSALCLMAHVRGFFDRNLPRDYPVEDWETESLLAAHFARKIASQETDDAAVAEQAFLAGLLHEVGSLLLAINVPERVASARRWACHKQVASWQAEQEILGTTHADLGACLLSQWGIAWPVVEAVALHHAARPLAEGSFTASAAVQAATAFAEESRCWNGAVAVEPLVEVARQRALAERKERWRQLCLAETHDVLFQAV